MIQNINFTTAETQNRTKSIAKVVILLGLFLSLVSSCSQETSPQLSNPSHPKEETDSLISEPIQIDEEDEEYGPIKVRPSIVDQGGNLVANLEVRIENDSFYDVATTNGVDVPELFVPEGTYTYTVKQNGVIIITDTIVVQTPLYERTDII